MSALQFKANDKVGLPTLNELDLLLPLNFREIYRENQNEFLELIKSEVIKLENYTIKLARSKFLGIWLILTLILIYFYNFLF